MLQEVVMGFFILPISFGMQGLSIYNCVKVKSPIHSLIKSIRFIFLMFIKFSEEPEITLGRL